jgi:DNA-binding NarL/FixJ family response regulator
LKPSIRVLVVDDFSPFREFLLTALGQMPDFVVVGEAADGIEALEKVRKLNPDLILLDIGLPNLSGIEVARQVQQFSPHSKILIVTGICEWDMILHAFLSGADGYLVKADAAAELRPAVELVLMGAHFLSTTAIRHVLDECKHGELTPDLNRISRYLAKRAEDESAE